MINKTNAPPILSSNTQKAKDNYHIWVSGIPTRVEEKVVLSEEARKLFLYLCPAFDGGGLRADPT